MHGRKKSSVPVSQDVLDAQKAKADTYTKLVNILFKQRKEGVHSTEILMLTGKMLRANPDFYTLWNYRRETLLALYNDLGLSEHISLCGCQQEQEEGSAIETFKKLGSEGQGILQVELELTADAIKKNPKSYGAWHHRQWIVDRVEFSVEDELALCRDFLAADQRNFHCWNYRRYIVLISSYEVKTAADQPEQCNEELEYSMRKIEENFSNYSAFHHRSVFLKKAGVAGRGGSPREVLERELGIVENAVFTEPDDQSAWWYHQFLLTWTTESLNLDDREDESGKEWFLGVLKAQMESLRSLLGMESDSKWALLTLAALIQRYLSFQASISEQPRNRTVTETVGEKGRGLVIEEVGDERTKSCNDTGLELSAGLGDDQLDYLRSERVEILTRLLSLDGSHSKRYLYLLAQK